MFARPPSDAALFFVAPRLFAPRIHEKNNNLRELFRALTTNPNPDTISMEDLEKTVQECVDFRRGLNINHHRILMADAEYNAMFLESKQRADQLAQFKMQEDARRMELQARRAP